MLEKIEMETGNNIKRSELWAKIFEKVNQIELADSGGSDSVDKPSLTTTLEELFLKEKEQEDVNKVREWFDKNQYDYDLEEYDEGGYLGLNEKEMVDMIIKALKTIKL